MLCSNMSRSGTDQLLFIYNKSLARQTTLTCSAAMHAKGSKLSLNLWLSSTIPTTVEYEGHTQGLDMMFVHRLQLAQPFMVVHFGGGADYPPYTLRSSYIYELYILSF